ncbi:MAG TPA: hypothetical protein DCY35_06355 [Prolixibacteraceae bacterium]|nr:hypothetical protein [Prolixibacteraceae bacterium]
MAMWRAIGFAADVICPDITGGMTTFLKAAEQFNVEVDDAGNFIRVVDSPLLPAEANEKPVEADKTPQLTLNDLVEKYGPEKIMEVNNGLIPTTLDEVLKVAKLLEEAGKSA